MEIAACCALQSFDHGIAPDRPIREQPLTTKGPIIIEDDVRLGHGVIVLSGVHIGEGAVIGAGSVVTKDMPAGAVAVGVPARVVRMRGEVVKWNSNPPKLPRMKGSGVWTNGRDPDYGQMQGQL